MRRAARFLLRSLAFAAMRASGLMARLARSLAYGTFTGQELDALSVAEWEAFGAKPSVADDRLFGWEEALFATQLRKGDSILVVGAGTGRDVLPLLRAGHALTALDITPQALRSLEARARAEALHVATVHASATDVTLPADSFDVVLFSWFSFSYIRGAAARREALARAMGVLRPGGRILVSYPRRFGSGDRPPLLQGLAPRVAHLIGGVAAEPGDEVNVTGSPSRPSVYFAHPFSPEEIEIEVREAGLSVLAHTQEAPGVGVLALVRESRPRP